MSIFKSILAKIFPSEHPANQTAPQASPGSAAPPAAGASSGAAAPAATTARSPETATGTPGVTSSMAAPAAANATSTSAAQSVDVEAVLREMQSKNSEKLNWQTSIVDLLKLLGLDSSLTARKQLAKELNYTGSTDDSATMNIWLHKEVMRKFAESGGKVPEDLKG